MNFIFRAIQFGFMHIWPALVLIFSAAVLPPQDIGTVAILMSIATLFRPLVGLSLGRTAIRYSGEGFAEGGEKRAEAILNLATRCGFWFSIIGAIGAVVAVTWVSGFYEFDLSTPSLVFGAIFVYFFGITEFLDGIFRARGAFRSLAVAIVLSRIFGIALFVVLLPFLPSLGYLLAFMAMAEIFGTVLLLRKLIPMSQKHDAPRLELTSPEAKQLISYSIPVIINALSVYFYARAMVLIAGMYDTSANIGSFELAVQLTNLPMAVTIICATVLSPAVARLVAQGPEGKDMANTLVSYGAAFAVWVNTGAAAYFTLVGPFILLWAFPDLPMAAYILPIIAPLIAAKAYAQILSGEIAVATGAAKTAAKITLVFGVITVFLGWLFARSYGVQGAAIAMFIAHSGAVIATLTVLQKKIGFSLNYRWKESLLTALIVSIPTLVAVLSLHQSPGWAAFIGTLVFFITLGITLKVSARKDLGLIEPLKDGLRMMNTKSATPNVQRPLIEERAVNIEKSPEGLCDGILEIAAVRCPAGMAFWRDGTGDALDIKWQDHADIIYTLRFLDKQNEISTVAAEKYLAAVADAALYGRPIAGPDAKDVPNAHMTAYILGAAKLVENATGTTLPDRAFDGWELDKIINTDTFEPLYPKAWAHHIWRVSHWIGGGPSILFNLARWGKVEGIDATLVDKVLAAAETGLLDPKTDLLHTYKSELLQKLFRKAYKIKHDPEIADIGGVVHLLWVYHASERPYRNPKPLFDKSWLHMHEETPFMESVPYCLDFDIVQLVRTAHPAGTPFPEDVAKRSDQFIQDTAAYLRAIPDDGYSLHKIPGALATMHEAAFMTDDTMVPTLDVPRIDIIKEAGWL